MTNDIKKYRIDRYINISLINGDTLTKSDSFNLTFSNPSIGKFKIKTCDPGNTFLYYLLGVWRSKCDVQIYNCS